MIELRKQVEGIAERPLQRFLASARRSLKLRDVGILLTSSREMRKLNRGFRGKDQPTDVLSFPAIKEVKNKFAGDLAVSLDIAVANARAFGHSTEAELKILILHGLLHLAGYDHETDAGQMARKEARLRHQFGLPSTLIDRTEGKPAVPAKRIAGTRSALKRTVTQRRHR